MIKIEESFLLVEILPIEVEKFNGFGKASGSLQDIAMLPVPFSKRIFLWRNLYEREHS